MSAPIGEIRACVFDAYGTLFDVHSSARAERERLGERWQALAELWRLKQLQYTWLRGLGARHADFRQVTADALDFSMESLGIDDPALRARLLDLYERLSCYPEAPAALRALKAGGLRLAILSNGTPEMLASAVRHAGLDGLLDEVLSVESVGIYKPHPSVYRLAADRLACSPRHIGFVSANGWDAAFAQANGMRALWCNRGGQPAERLPDPPEHVVTDLDGLPSLLLTSSPENTE